MKPNESEPLDELSKATLRSYIDGARSDSKRQDRDENVGKATEKLRRKNAAAKMRQEEVEQPLTEAELISHLRDVGSGKHQDPVRFADGHASTIPHQVAKSAVSKYESYRTPQEKASFTQNLGASLSSFKKTVGLKEDYEMNESTQLDEISAGLVGRYIRKAATDKSATYDRLHSQEVEKEIGAGPGRNPKDVLRADKRWNGIELAKQKLMADKDSKYRSIKRVAEESTEDMNENDFTQEDFDAVYEDIMDKINAGEQLDELSKNLLGRYISLASIDKSGRATNVGHENGVGEMGGHPDRKYQDSENKKHGRRSAGIQSATNKIIGHDPWNAKWKQKRPATNEDVNEAMLPSDWAKKGFHTVSKRDSGGEVGTHRDFYDKKTGEKRYGKIVKNTATHISFHDPKDNSRHHFQKVVSEENQNIEFTDDQLGLFEDFMDENELNELSKDTLKSYLGKKGEQLAALKSKRGRKSNADIAKTAKMTTNVDRAQNKIGKINNKEYEEHRKAVDANLETSKHNFNKAVHTAAMDHGYKLAHAGKHSNIYTKHEEGTTRDEWTGKDQDYHNLHVLKHHLGGTESTKDPKWTLHSSNGTGSHGYHSNWRGDEKAGSHEAHHEALTKEFDRHHKFRGISSLDESTIEEKMKYDDDKEDRDEQYSNNKVAKKYAQMKKQRRKEKYNFEAEKIETPSIADSDGLVISKSFAEALARIVSQKRSIDEERAVRLDPRNS